MCVRLCVCVWCVPVNQTAIGSDNGLSSVRHQAIIWTRAELLIIGPLGANFFEILIEIFHWRKCISKCRLQNSGNLFSTSVGFNTLRPRQDGRYFADDVLKCIFLNENVWISLKIPLKFVSKGPINNIQELVQIMAWRRPGDKPLSEPMLVFVPTHICVTRPQWIK